MTTPVPPNVAKTTPKPMAVFGKKVPDGLANVIRKTWQVVKEIFKTLVAALFFVTNPSLFAVGLLVGVAFEIKAKQVVDKVMNVWKTQPWKTAALLGVGAFLALPVTWAAVSFLSAAYYGSRFTRQAQKHMAKKNQTPLTPAPAA